MRQWKDQWQQLGRDFHIQVVGSNPQLLSEKTAFKNSHFDLLKLTVDFVSKMAASWLDSFSSSVIYIIFSDIIFFFWPQTQFLKGPLTIESDILMELLEKV